MKARLRRPAWILLGAFVCPVAAAPDSDDPGSRGAWRVSSGNPGGTRYSALDQINRTNVRSLEPAWIFRTGDLQREPASTIQCTPIVVDGRMYLTTAGLKVVALEAASGRKIWAFDLASNGAVSSQRLVFDFARGRGGDGMCVDSQGTLYIAAGVSQARGPHETTDVPPGVYAIRPDGRVLGRIPVYEDVITNCTWGGLDLKTLYITAGKTVYQTDVEVPGWVVHRKK